LICEINLGCTFKTWWALFGVSHRLSRDQGASAFGLKTVKALPGTITTGNCAAFFSLLKGKLSILKTLIYPSATPRQLDGYWRRKQQSFHIVFITAVVILAI